MKPEYRYRENPVQDLLNAVMIQAAADYRVCCKKLMKNPKNRAAIEEKEEIRRFFLSEDFIAYSQADGAMILSRLDAEQRKLEKAYLAYRAHEAEVLPEVRKCAKLLIQWQSGETEDLFQRGQEQEKIVRRMIEDLREEKERLPKEIQNSLRPVTYEDVMSKAYRKLQEDIRNGKEELRS